MAEDVVVAQLRSYKLELEPGEYWWCRCGRSAGQPLCDGSHKGTGLSPVKFEVPAKQIVALCGCKHTATQPFCDGTHKQLAQP